MKLQKKLQQLRMKTNKGVRILAPQDLLQRFCARLHVDIEGERAATAVLEVLQKSAIHGEASLVALGGRVTAQSEYV